MNKQPEENVLDVLTSEEANLFAEQEAIVKENLTSFLAAGAALTIIRDKKLYRALYGTFEAYCEQKWDIKRAHAYRLMDAFELSQTTGYTPSSEAEAREIKRLKDPEDQILFTRAMQMLTGSVNPSSAQLRAAVDTIIDMHNTGTIEHPQTQEPVRLSDLPEQQRVEIIKETIVQKAQDLKTYQSADRKPPLGDTLSNLTQNMVFPQTGALLFYPDESGNPKFKFVLVSDQQKLDLLAEGEAANYLSTALSNFLKETGQ